MELQHIKIIKHFSGNLRGVTTKRQVKGVNQRSKAREAKLKKQLEVSSFTNSYLAYK